jgi:hypothetical protein
VPTGTLDASRGCKDTAIIFTPQRPTFTIPSIYFVPITLFIDKSRYNLNNNLNYIILPMKKQQYKRQYRELSEETKSKISKSLKGRQLSTSHRKAIADSLKSYWSTVKSKYEV